MKIKKLPITLFLILIITILQKILGILLVQKTLPFLLIVEKPIPKHLTICTSM